MRVKRSSTASGIYSFSGPFTPPLPILVVPIGKLASRSVRGPLPCPATAQDEGLLHDARNLMGALGLYCDLLAMPGVLKPEHSHYSEEMRLLGTRSGSLIESMMQSLAARGETDGGCVGVGGPEPPARARAGIELRAMGPASALQPVSLRAVVERRLGLLCQVAGGRAIEVNYGPAAAIPVRIAGEAMERILVNLVGNAAAALGETPGAIRIGVGLLVNRVGDASPWPFRRVRFAVEDSGCGMTPERLGRLLCAGRTPSRGGHGIGFRVVQELVAATDGDLRVMSTPGIGTRVQIEWPVATMDAMDAVDTDLARGDVSAVGYRGEYSGGGGRPARAAGRPAYRVSPNETGTGCSSRADSQAGSTLFGDSGLGVEGWESC